MTLLQHQQLPRQYPTISLQLVHVRPGCQVSTVVILSVPGDDAGTCNYVTVLQCPHPLAQQIVDGQGRLAFIRQDKTKARGAVEGIRVVLLQLDLARQGRWWGWRCRHPGWSCAGETGDPSPAGGPVGILGWLVRAGVTGGSIDPP